MGTMRFAAYTYMAQLMFIDNRAYPGGPDAWFASFHSTGIIIAGNGSYVFANFLADGLLVSPERIASHDSALTYHTALASARCLGLQAPDHRGFLS